VKEVILGLLSIGMVSCYIASAFYCAINLWYNKDVIDPIIKQSFVFFFVATIAMVICGYDWIVNADYMKIPTWQALGWGIIHVSMPSGFFMINEWICQKSSIIKCEAIKQKVIAELKITNTLQGHVGYLK
jgi:vacuolar-type H+-ATPase subunit I/STV1